MTAIQRYEHSDEDECYGMQPAPNGHYVFIDDHEAAVTAARAEGMREAHAIAARFEDKYWRPMRVFRTDEEVAVDEGKRDVAEEIANTILAAIPEASK